MSKSKNPLKSVLDQTERTVAIHGHAVIGIAADAKAKPPTPGFAYTVGLETTYGQPELIIFGLPYDVAHGVLNDIAARIKNDGFAPKDGDSDDQTLRGNRVFFRAVPASVIGKHLRIAHVLREDVSALQIIWPDPFGKFPWEDGADLRYAYAQPLLYETKH
ncbi:DUF4262 domain-containing protein [Caballeronia sp. LZ029]|uniref:DUF4262 domain-containing protein n=1 Tax=Caballeronia sp. LZ029 TaxID=3038564 RepID=UPI0028652D32|nr:DUF4262 domain-containing protein [Caballeronia sp. LZ029]MDR5744441.1 DUF4262 domain-containing protein [Caballeronia sp. LZ029]